jgi:hypothetical protein
MVNAGVRNSGSDYIYNSYFLTSSGYGKCIQTLNQNALGRM